MVEFDNPVSGAVFLRFVGPLVPVWLGGAALVLALDQSPVGGPPLATADLGGLLLIYSVLVAGLVSALFFRESRRSPARLELSVEGVAGRFGRAGGHVRTFAYERILRVQRPGYFTARVEARSEGGSQVDWMNLTAENALRIREAWGAWCQRRAAADGGAAA